MITTRAYRPEDRGVCQSIFYRAVHEGTGEFYSEDQRKAWAASDRFDPDVPDRLITQMTWVAEADGEPVGFMSLREDGYLDMAFVLVAFHGRGVADALYAQVMNTARERRMERLFVDASPMARRFFIKHGWQVDYHEQHPARGQVFDRFRLTLLLRETAE